MINFEIIINNILNEQSPNSSIRSKLEYAIKNRYPVSFYYRGPKGEVLPGRRIKVELVASGLTKKGNLAVRGYVQPPSTSKKGFSEHGWRTFIIDRISYGSLNIYEDEQFNTKRPKYKEGNDGSFTTTYVTSDWGTLKQPEKIEPNKIPTPQPKQPEKSGLPQPKTKEKPTSTPTPELKRENEVYDNLKSKVTTVNNVKQLSPTDFKLGIDELYKKRLEDWKIQQQKIGKNTNAGEGTRRKIEKESEIDLSKLLNQNNIKVIETPINNPEETKNKEELQEQIKRVKTLIFF